MKIYITDNKKLNILVKQLEQSLNVSIKVPEGLIKYINNINDYPNLQTVLKGIADRVTVIQEDSEYKLISFYNHFLILQKIKNIQIDDYILTDNSIGKVLKVHNENLVEVDLDWDTSQTRTLHDSMKIIACSKSNNMDDLPVIKNSKEEIYKLYEEFQIEQLSFNRFPKIDLTNITNGTDLTSENRLGFIEGYKANDKKYSEQDLKNAYHQGSFDNNAIAQSMNKKHKAYKNFDEYIESLRLNLNCNCQFTIYDNIVDIHKIY